MSDNNIYFLGLGGNLGDVPRAFSQSLKELRAENVKILSCSAIYKSPALQLPNSKIVDQPDYLNAVIKVSVDYEPSELLQKIKAVEKKLGRIAGEKWGARPIDIDIIAGGSRVVDTTDLSLPHLEMHKRLFVLLPLRELDASWIHPKTNLGIDSLIKQINKDSSMHCEKHLPFVDCECE